MTYDIIIIGGGITGVSIAYELAKKKAGKILLLEKEFLSAGSSGSCAAGIRAQFGSEFNIGLMKLALEKFEVLAEELEYPADRIGLWQGGYLVMSSSQPEWESLKARVIVQHRLNVMTEVLTPGEVKYRFPDVNVDGCFGATYHSKDGHADPFYTVFAYGKAAERFGVEIRKRTEVTELVRDDQGIKGVRLADGGTIEAKQVLVATGAWTHHLMKTIGLDIPLWGERHEILITEPVERVFSPMVISFSLGYYIQQRPHGSFIMGLPPEQKHRWFDPAQFDISPTWGFLERMSDTVQRILPRFKGLNIVRQWAGLYEITPDSHHIIGPIEEVPGLFIAAGGSGHGFMYGPGLAPIMAEWMLGQPLSYDITRLNYQRFAKGELVIEPAVVG